jgi:cysteine desulfurase NifS
MFEIDSYMTYGPIFRLREKVVEPVGEARNDYLIMAELANRLGYGDRYPQTEEAMIRMILDGSGYSLEDVKAAGGWVEIPRHVLEYRKWEKGGLREDGRPGFDTPTGKFEIASTVLDDYGYEPLPKYVEPTEGPLASPHLGGEFPLVFNSGARTQVDFRSQHHGIPGLLEDNPEPAVEINADDARERGIEPGDLVEIRTPRGAVRFRARVTDDIVRGAVECNMGGGTPVGPKAWQDSNVNELTDLQNYDEISGFPVYKALLCEAVKVESGTDETRRVAAAPATGIRSRRAPRIVRPEPSARRIYLDNNATTELADSVRDSMEPFLNGSHGNPSSIHGLGREARDAIEEARRSVSRLIGAKPRRIVFTGSGSESINLAIKGVAFARRERGNHIITSTIEHPAVLQTCRALESMGFEVTWLGVDDTGRIDPEALEDAIGPGTILVSLMTANNEVGTVQPIRELAGIARDHGVLFHTDAVQACGKIPVDVDHFRVDLLSGSAHKFHGPKGVGFLYVRKDLELLPLVHGGSQEGGLRAGTENVPGIVGAGKAAELARRHVADPEGLRALRDELEAGFRDLIPGAVRNGPEAERLPNTVNLTLPGIRGESLVVALDQKGISLSSGSACKSVSPEPTHVLLAMGRSEDEAHRAVRLSLSRETTGADVRETLAALDQVLREMETTVRFLPCK